MKQHLKLFAYLLGIFGLIFLRTKVSNFVEGDDATIINSLIVLIIVLLIFRAILTALAYYYRLIHKQQNISTDNIIVGLKNLFTILSVGAGILTFFSLIGVDPTTLFTTISIFAAALAIVTKDFITEMTIGIINSFSTKIEIGDYIQAAGQKGKIIDIGLQKVTLLNDNDDLLYIPNSKVYNGDIINFTKGDIRKMSVGFEIPIKFVGSLSELETELKEELHEYREFIKPDSYNIKIVKCTHEYLDLKFQYILENIDRELQLNIRKKTLRKVFDVITRKSFEDEE